MNLIKLLQLAEIQLLTTNLIDLLPTVFLLLFETFFVFTGIHIDNHDQFYQYKTVLQEQKSTILMSKTFIN